MRRLKRIYLDCLAVAAFCLAWQTLRLGGVMETVVAVLFACAGWLLVKHDDGQEQRPWGGVGMPSFERIVICLEDGRELCITIRALPWWRLAIRITVYLCGILAVLAGGWLLSQGYKDSAVYAAVAGFGLLVMAKE